MPRKKAHSQEKPSAPESNYSDAQLVAYCGINCKECKMHTRRRVELGTKFMEALQELPLEIFSQILPPFKNIQVVMDFLESLPQIGSQTCCTDEKLPCGNPACEIRACVKDQGFRTCGECTGYRTCSKLNFLKPHHPTLMFDLQLIEEKGLEHYVNEVVSKFQLNQIIIE
ncbi:MAG TPA: DUF3795 domain-containing protein [Candidatus Lokiarchaeia archaeon]|nr:DUF3795 domain-containing protein [Candidatus Lokiarchaeia archaeon]